MLGYPSPVERPWGLCHSWVTPPFTVIDRDSGGTEVGETWAAAGDCIVVVDSSLSLAMLVFAKGCACQRQRERERVQVSHLAFERCCSQPSDTIQIKLCHSNGCEPSVAPLFKPLREQVVVLPQGGEG